VPVGAFTGARTKKDGGFIAGMSTAFDVTAPGQQDGIHFWTPEQMSKNLLRLDVLDRRNGDVLRGYCIQGARPQLPHHTADRRWTRIQHEEKK
jgi:hypothetical protein